MNRPFVFSAAFLLLFHSLAHAEAPWWRSFGEVQKSHFGGGFREDSDKPASKELKEFLTQTKFQEWETHEDEFVSISYPKHPLLKLEIKGGRNGISVEGGVCTTVDNSFQKAYVLRAENYTYGVFLLSPADWLDDGICLCGPMVHHAYQTKDGCLTRFSLLPGGAVKKAQVLGGKLRLMAFEWTHLACPREIYEGMVERMTLKIKHPKTPGELRAEVIKRYGLDGAAGLLHPGDTLAQAEEIMQTKPQQKDDQSVWNGIVDDYPCIVAAVFSKGTLVKLVEEVHRTGEPALKGSLNWIRDRIEAKEENSSGSNQVRPQYTDGEKEEMIQALLRKVADGNPENWWTCVELMRSMESEWKTPAKRFTEVILQHAEGEVAEMNLLAAANYEGLTGWVENQLKNLMENQSKPKTPALAAMMDDGAEKPAAFLGYLCENAPAKAKTAAKTLWETNQRHYCLAVINVLDKLPASEVDFYAEQGLELAQKHKDADLMEGLVEVLPRLKLARAAELMEAIASFEFPEREGVFLPENYWKNKIADLRQEMAKKTKK